MTIDLTQIILAVITLIFGVLMRYVIPAAKEKLNADQLEALRIAVKVGVYAAEQLYNSDQGQAKKQYVLDYLRKAGYLIDDTEIEGKTSEMVNALIEAMVKELHLEQAKAA